MSNELEQGLKAVSERIVDVARERGVLGEPLTVGDTSILPLSEIKLGFGGGGGEGEGEGEGENPNSEGGAGTAAFGFGGGGVRVTPLALVIVTDDDVILEGLEEGGEL